MKKYFISNNSNSLDSLFNLDFLNENVSSFLIVIFILLLFYFCFILNFNILSNLYTCVVLLLILIILYNILC